MKKLMTGVAAALVLLACVSCPTDGGDSQETATVPTGVAARAQSSSAVYISWTGIVNADYYTVYRESDAGNQAFSVFNAYDYTDNSLAPDTRYGYQVSATKGGVEGAKSATVFSKTLPAGSLPVPEQVTGVTAAVDGGSVTLAWNPANGASSYKVERGADSSGPWTTVYNNAAETCTNTGLQAGTWYYRVAASNASGTGPWSETRVAVVSGGSGTGDGGGTGDGTGTGNGTPAANAPQAPAGLSVTARTENSLTLSWQAVSGATGYRVSRNGATPRTTLSTSYTDTGLDQGTTYQYQVRAYNGQGDGSPASVSGTTTTPNVPPDGIVIPPPAKPTGLVVSSPAAGSITISWNGVTADSYEIWRSNTSNSAPSRIGTSTGTSYTDASVPPGSTNYYTVKAVNASGSGASSDKAFAYAATHYGLSNYAGSYTLNLPANGKHYYRLAVTAGQSYTITWEDGNNADLSRYLVRCGAWQNNGTAIFTDAVYGYTSPQAFTASATGYVTVEVRNIDGSTGFDYKIYYH